MLRVILNYRLLTFLALGVISGMPFAFIYTAITVWLKELDVSLVMIGIFASTKIPYSLKPLWAPLLDNIKIPVLNRVFGHRKSWMILSLICLCTSIFVMSLYKPSEYLSIAWYNVLIICFFSANFDAALDAFRIESLEEDLQALGIACAVNGYRVGMLIGGAGVLYLSTIFSWSESLRILSLLIASGIIFTIILPEQGNEHSEEKKSFFFTLKNTGLSIINQENAFLMLSIIVLYKAGEAILGAMLNPFYLHLGYNKVEIAGVAKLFGLGATLFGVFIGGIVSVKFGSLKSLLYCGFFQMISNLIFVWLNHHEANLNALTIAIFIENVTGGMGTSVLVGYISKLCVKNYTATHYAAMSSLSSFINNTMSATSGGLVEMMGWDMFFVFTTIISLPALILIVVLNNKLTKNV